MRGASRAALFLLRSAIVGLAVAFVVLVFEPRLLGLKTGDSPSYAKAVNASSASVVNIHSAGVVGSASKQPTHNPPERHPHEFTSLGSGVIVSADGYVLTNDHVVKNADRIEVGLADGRSAAAKVIGVDPDTDLALLKIDLPHLDPIRLGRSRQLAVGDVVLAIGDPYGVGQTVTQGIVSAKGRSRLGLSTFENFIQTDAAINPGNSGGALIDSAGRLVGINTALFSPAGGSNGIGFAIPVKLARGVMRDLIKYGRVPRGWAGLDVQNLTPRLARALNVETAGGVVVKGVQPNGPAAQAGIRIGDVLTAIAGRPIAGFHDALDIIAGLKPGSPARITVNRHGDVVKVKLVVSERPVEVNS
jgi:serine peptidase DegS